MKKMLAIVAVLSCAASAAYGVSFITPSAAGTVAMGVNTGGVGGTLAYKPSANVAMAYDAATALGVSYTVGSIHGQGNRAFGTSSVDTNIFYIPTVSPGIQPVNTAITLTGVTFPASVAITPSTYFASGWTASK